MITAHLEALDQMFEVPYKLRTSNRHTSDVTMKRNAGIIPKALLCITSLALGVGMNGWRDLYSNPMHWDETKSSPIDSTVFFTSEITSWQRENRNSEKWKKSCVNERKKTNERMHVNTNIESQTDVAWKLGEKNIYQGQKNMLIVLRFCQPCIILRCAVPFSIIEMNSWLWDKKECPAHPIRTTRQARCYANGKGSGKQERRVGGNGRPCVTPLASHHKVPVTAFPLLEWKPQS